MKNNFNGVSLLTGKPVEIVDNTGLWKPIISPPKLQLIQGGKSKVTPPSLRILNGGKR